MKTVDIINLGSINSITGPVANLKRILNHSDYFRQRGYDVSVFAQESLSLGPLKIEPKCPLQKTAKLTLRARLSSKLRMMARNSKLLSMFYIRRHDSSANNFINYYLKQDRNPDVVEFQDWASCYYFLKNNKKKNIKTVLFYHTDGKPFEMDLQYYPKLRGSKFLENRKRKFDWTVSSVDKMVFIARAGQRNFLQLYTCRSLNNTTVILNGIDDFNEDEKKYIDDRRKKLDSGFPYRLCCSGTINYRKGQNIIIEALTKLPKSLLNSIHVDFIGEGAERPVLENFVKSNGLENNVSFLGMVPNKDVYKYLSTNNIYILMSRYEGLPISIIEGMRAGMAVISTNIAGIPELVSDKCNGVLLNPDVNELVNLLLKISAYDWDQMGKESRRKFENEFTFVRMMKEYCDMYDSL